MKLNKAMNEARKRVSATSGTDTDIKEYDKMMKDIKREIKKIEAALKTRELRTRKKGHYEQTQQLFEIKESLGDALAVIQSPIELD